MLLERDAELAAIGDRLDDGGLVVVEGAAGIGKTSLLAVAAERAAVHGTRVLAARAAPLEQAYGFGVVRQLFEPVRAGCDVEEWQRLTADAAGLALRALDPAAAVAAPGDDVTHATLHGLFWLAANLAAQGPLVLSVDDAHWADAPSLRWLGYLARRLEGLPVLALVAVRTGEPASEPRLLDDLLAEPRALLLRPRPLGPDSSAAVVRGRIGDAAPEFCTACHDATGGNPFLLEALIASVRAEGHGADARAAEGIEHFGPEAVARALDRRLERLGARELARSLAVLGDDAAPREVAALAGLDAAKAAVVSDALRAGGVLGHGRARAAAPQHAPMLGAPAVAGPEARLAFAHPILRAAVLAGLGPAERALWHSRAAGLLRAEGAEPERVAVQLLEADPAGEPDAVRALRAAALAATARGAPESATAYLRRALAEPPGPGERPAVLLELGLALAAHRHPHSPALLHEAVESIADPAARGPAAVRAARALGLAALYADVVGICRQTLAGASELPPDDVARLEAELIGIGMTRAEGHEEIRELVGRIRRDPPAVPLWRVVAAAGDTYDARPARESIALVSPLLREEVLAAERESLVATVVLMFVLIWNDALDAAKAVADGLLAAARPRGWASAVANGSFMRALAQVRRGEVADAEADIRPAFEFKRSVSPPDSLAWALLPLVDTLVERDELDGAERALAAGRAEVLTPDLLVFPLVVEARARLRLAQRRPEEALADARAAAASWRLHGTDAPAWPAGAYAPPRRSSRWATPRRRASSRASSSRWPSASAPRGRSAPRCAPSRAARRRRTRSRRWSARWRCCATARRSSSTCARWWSSARRCAGAAAARRRVSRCARRCTSPTAAAPCGSPRVPARSCTPRAPGRGAPRSPAATR